MSLDVRGDMGVTGHTRGRQCHLHKRTHGCHWVHIPSPQSAFIFRDVRLRGFWMTQWRKDHVQGELRGAEGPEPGGLRVCPHAGSGSGAKPHPAPSSLPLTEPSLLVPGC